MKKGLSSCGYRDAHRQQRGRHGVGDPLTAQRHQDPHDLVDERDRRQRAQLPTQRVHQRQVAAREDGAEGRVVLRGAQVRLDQVAAIHERRRADQRAELLLVDQGVAQRAASGSAVVGRRPPASCRRRRRRGLRAARRLHLAREEEQALRGRQPTHVVGAQLRQQELERLDRRRHRVQGERQRGRRAQPDAQDLGDHRHRRRCPHRCADHQRQHRVMRHHLAHVGLRHEHDAALRGGGQPVADRREGRHRRAVELGDVIVRR